MKSRNKKNISPLFQFLLRAISALCLTGAVIVRFVQLCNFTDSVTGTITPGHESSVLALYGFVLVFVICIIHFCARSEVRNPFGGAPSRGLQLCSFLAGAAMFYDFVRQCLNCYYYARGEYSESVYMFFIALNALFALISAFYFFCAGAPFNTPNYDFTLLGGLHTAPFLWALSRLLFCLSIIVNPVYSQEDILSFALIACLVLFFMFYLTLVDSQKARPEYAAVFGFISSFLAVVLSLPRLGLSFFDISLYSVYYSSVAYFFIGIFVFAFSLNILISDRKV